MNSDWFYKKRHHSELYIKYRPTLSDDLYQVILDYCQTRLETKNRKHSLALDIGCGPGNSTLPLVPYFDEVIGVDSSECQIELAREISKQVRNISYICSPAENLSPISDCTVDLITVSQALHWFDQSVFYEECLRVLKPGGIVAVICLKLMVLKDNQEINSLFRDFVQSLQPYSEDGIKHFLEPYESISRDFDKTFFNVQRITSHHMTETKSLEILLGFFKSLSAYQKYKTLLHSEPDIIETLKNRIIEIVYKEEGKLFDAEKALETNLTYDIPVFILIGYKPLN